MCARAFCVEFILLFSVILLLPAIIEQMAAPLTSRSAVQGKVGTVARLKELHGHFNRLFLQRGYRVFDSLCHRVNCGLINSGFSLDNSICCFIQRGDGFIGIHCQIKERFLALFYSAVIRRFCATQLSRLQKPIRCSYRQRLCIGKRIPFHFIRRLCKRRLIWFLRTSSHLKNSNS